MDTLEKIKEIEEIVQAHYELTVKAKSLDGYDELNFILTESVDKKYILKIPLKGLNAVIVGASNIVGKPMALELLNAGCTITVCHSATRNLKQSNI